MLYAGYSQALVKNLTSTETAKSSSLDSFLCPPVLTDCIYHGPSDLIHSFFSRPDLLPRTCLKESTNPSRSSKPTLSWLFTTRPSCMEVGNTITCPPHVSQWSIQLPTHPCFELIWWGQCWSNIFKAEFFFYLTKKDNICAQSFLTKPNWKKKTTIRNRESSSS